jgi:hypothetical protein
MKTFEEYLDKMGYSWNDFDRTYEMEGLIEQYANERINQALRIHDVVGRSEQLPCDYCGEVKELKYCQDCWEKLEQFKQCY